MHYKTKKGFKKRQEGWIKRMDWEHIPAPLTLRFPNPTKWQKQVFGRFLRKGKQMAGDLWESKMEAPSMEEERAAVVGSFREEVTPHQWLWTRGTKRVGWRAAFGAARLGWACPEGCSAVQSSGVYSQIAAATMQSQTSDSATR